MFMNHEPSLKTDHLRPPHPKTSNSVVNLNLNSNLGTKGHESKAPCVRVALDDDGKICGESESCPRRANRGGSRLRTTRRDARAIGGRLEPSSPKGGRVARGSDSRGKILTRHRAARGARERRAPRAAATIEFYDFSFVIRASRANLASGARRADGGELD